MKRPKGKPYVCGYPHCQARIILPDHGDAARHDHRDKNGFRCRGILVAYDVSEVGRRERMAWAYEKEQIIESYRRQRSLPRWMTKDGVKRLMERDEKDAAKRG